MKAIAAALAAAAVPAKPAKKSKGNRRQRRFIEAMQRKVARGQDLNPVQAKWLEKLDNLGIDLE